MADITDIEKTAPPLFNIKSPLDYSKFNPVAGTYPNVEKQQSDILAANDLLAKRLEERYAQPNWFKVAAGFLKPQLGGFGASLGTAAQALGENTEAQRAIAPSIARMRAETAQGRLGLETNKSQYQALQDYNKAGKNDTVELQRILAMSPESDVGSAVKTKMELDRASREGLGFGLDVQKALLDNPALSLDTLKNPSMEFGRTADEAAANLKAMNALVPQGYTREGWENLGYGDKTRALAEAQSKRSDTVMEEGQKSSQKADDANNFLDLAAPTRTLAADPELAPLFSLGKNGDLFAQARAFLNTTGGNTNAAMEGLYAAAMEKLKNASPEARAKADKLIKNIFAMEVQMRGSLRNPTDVATALSAQRSPSLENSQAGFLGILDQLGLSAYRDIEEHSLRKRLKVPNNELVDTAVLRKFRNDSRKMASDMAAKSALDATPSFYYSTEPPAPTADAAPKPASGKAPAIPTTAATPAATSAAPAATGTTLAAIQAEIARRAAAAKGKQ